MPIKGSLEEASVHDILQLLSLGQKTGCLSVTNWSNLGHIYVAAGRIIYADIVNRRDRLGDMLVRRGRITQEQLDKAVRMQDLDRDKKLGELLLKLGAISREELERHMRLQIEEAVYFLFGWSEGSFTFEADVAPPEAEFRVSIEPESLMLEGARRTDEWPHIEAKIPSFGIVFKADQQRLASSQKTLTSEQHKIVPLLDGSRDVGEIVDQTGLPEFDVAKALYGLVTAGLAHQVARRHSDRRLSASGVRVDLEAGAPPKRPSGPRHLDEQQLAAYVAREGPYADAGRRREAAFHICDCVLCSDRLKELHKQRTAEHKGQSARQPLQAPSKETTPRSGERRTGVDRRQSGATATNAARSDSGRPTTAMVRGGVARPQTERRTGIDRRESDRRIKAAGPVSRQTDTRGPGTTAPRSSVEIAMDRRSGTDRRSWVERRQGDRRKGERRRGSAVDRTDRYAVERRTRPERRKGDRRATVRRATDRLMLPMDQGGGAGAGPGRAAAAVAAKPAVVPAPAPRRSTRQSAAPEARRPRAEAPTAAAPKQVRSAADNRPNLRLTESERQSLAGLPLIEEPKLARPGTPRTSLPPVKKAAPPIRDAKVASLPAVPERDPQMAPVTPSRKKRSITVGIVAAVAVMLGWFGRPLLQSVVGGTATTASLGEEVEPGSPARVTPPAVASAAVLEAAETVEDATSPAADSEPPLAQPPAEPTAAPPTRQPSAREVAGAVAAPPAAVQRPTVSTAPARLPRLVGTVRSERSGTPLAGVRVVVEGTNLATTTDAAGSFEFAGVPTEPFAVRLSRDGFVSTTQQVIAGAGSEARLDVSLTSPPAALEPDVDLSDGAWVTTDRAGAEAVLGGPVAILRGLWVESIAKPAEGARRQIRIAQLTQSGERVVLTLTAAGPAGGAAPAQVTAIRVRPAAGSDTFAMGTASFGHLLVTAKTRLPADSLRVQLQRLRESDDAEGRQ